jgi:hypothetical protein
VQVGAGVRLCRPRAGRRGRGLGITAVLFVILGVYQLWNAIT